MNKEIIGSSHTNTCSPAGAPSAQHMRPLFFFTFLSGTCVHNIFSGLKTSWDDLSSIISQSLEGKVLLMYVVARFPFRPHATGLGWMVKRHTYFSVHFNHEIGLHSNGKQAPQPVLFVGFFHQHIAWRLNRKFTLKAELQQKWASACVQARVTFALSPSCKLHK